MLREPFTEAKAAEDGPFRGQGDHLRPNRVERHVENGRWAAAPPQVSDSAMTRMRSALRVGCHQTGPGATRPPRYETVTIALYVRSAGIQRR